MPRKQQSPYPAPPPPFSPIQPRVEAAAKVLQVEPPELWKCLRGLGIKPTDTDAVDLLDRADESAFDAFQELAGTHLPEESRGLLRLRKAWEILIPQPAASDHARTKALTSTQSIRPIEQWSDADLLVQYDVDCDGRILDELAKRAKDQAVIVFDADGQVACEASLELLRLSRRQKIPSTYLVDGKIQRTCRVGEFPQSWFEECPIHEDTILANGYCEKCVDSWKGTHDKERVLVRIARMLGMFPNGSPLEAHQAMEMASAGVDAFKEIPAVEAKFRELQEEGKIPRLRKRTSQGKKADPFFVHRQY